MHRPPHHHASSPVKPAGWPWPTPAAGQATTRNERQRSPDCLPGDHHLRRMSVGRTLTCGDARSKSVLSRLTCISHLTADFAPEQVGAGVAAYNTLVPDGITARTHREVTGLFGRLSLVAPGVVPVSEWRPEHARCAASAPTCTAGSPPLPGGRGERCISRPGRDHPRRPRERRVV
jgi:S-adenosyl methyltransferase